MVMFRVSVQKPFPLGPTWRSQQDGATLRTCVDSEGKMHGMRSIVGVSSFSSSPRLALGFGWRSY